MVLPSALAESPWISPGPAISTSHRSSPDRRSRPRRFSPSATSSVLASTASRQGDCRGDPVAIRRDGEVGDAIVEVGREAPGDHAGRQARQREASLDRAPAVEGVEVVALARGEIEALRGVGVRFALDDYGTGKAGPEDLRRLPLDIVKIDQRVVAEIGTDRSAVVIREAIAIARELGLKTTAEGVETKAQEAFLRECGCDTLQGYLYSRPVVARAIAELLNQAQT